MDLTDLIETDRFLDALGNYSRWERWERILKKPRLVVFIELTVTSYDILGEKIPELCGEYTPELKQRLDERSDEKTQSTDIEVE